MADSWTEKWSVGRGRTRKYCGVAQTEDGFAVDVFDGDTCVFSQIFGSKKEAEASALSLKARYGQVMPPPPVVTSREHRLSV